MKSSYLNELTKYIKDIELLKKIILASDIKVFLILRIIKLNNKEYIDLIQKILISDDNNLKYINEVCTNRLFLLKFEKEEQLKIINILLDKINNKKLFLVYYKYINNNFVLENRSFNEIIKILLYMENINLYKLDYAYEVLSNNFINSMRSLDDIIRLCNLVMLFDYDNIDDAIKLATNYEILKNETTEDQIKIIIHNEEKEYSNKENAKYVTVKEYISNISDTDSVKKLSMILKENGINYFDNNTSISL